MRARYWVLLLVPVSLLALSVAPSVAQTRIGCIDGLPAHGVVVAVDGDVTARGAGGVPFAVSVGTPLCPLDEIRTGSRSRVEFRLAGKDTTTGSSSNALTVLPARDDGCVGLLGGIIALISSVEGTHCVRTPFIDAGIEGTEAIVAVDAATGDSFVLVSTGLVAVVDRRVPAARLLLDADPGEGRAAAFATAGQRLTVATPENVPAKFRDLLLNPEGAIDWAIYYPPILIGSAVSDPVLAEAAALLDGGQPDRAEALLAGARLEGDAAAAGLALRAIGALARNRTAEGVALADEAVARAPRLGASRIVRSYALQATGDLDGALEEAEAAVAAAPGDPYAWARLAELHLTVGAYRPAERAVERSLAIAETALGRTMQGFATLQASDFAAAEAAFARAIAIDSEAPLPRLGLGLAAVRQGRVAEGRLEMETAVALDPRRSSLRTWLGRAYFEEDRPDKAATQFELAQELDPDDPNAYLFAALERHQANDPIGALRQVEAAEARGDRRAVVRSEQGLGEDRAVRGAAIGRIYDVLGFERLFRIAAAAAVDEDPTSPEPHRMLADAARTDPRGEITQVSELLKGRILLPPSKAPLQPQLGEVDLGLFETTGAARVTFAEYAPLFDGNGLAGYGAGFGGSQETFGYEASVSGLHDTLSFAAGGFLYDTDGYGVNNDLRHEIYSAEIRFRPAPEITFFAELGRRDTRGGDRRIDVSPRLPRNDNLRVSLENNQLRLGGLVEPNERITVIGYAEVANQDSTFVETPGLLTTAFTGEQDGYKLESLALMNLGLLDVEFGAEYAHVELAETTEFSIPGVPFPPVIEDGAVEFWRLHASGDIEVPTGFTWTAGLAYERYEEIGTLAIEIGELQPKFGLRIEPFEGVALRGAYTESLVRPTIFPETLERTTYARFQQFFEDAPGTEYRSIGFGIDLGPFHGVRAGAAAERLKIFVPDIDPDVDPGPSEAESVTLGGYLATTIGDDFAISVEPEWEMTESDALFQAAELDTFIVPVTGSFFHRSGLFATATLSYYDQEGLDAGVEFSDQGFVTDAAIGFRLPRDRGLISVEALNLFDADVDLISRDARLTLQNFGDVLLSRPIFAPDFTVLATATLRL